ncbi:class I SAM-dependent methyltransferase [Paenibacillus hamazuiensis]|uniref:class I SAM-dependent methyltransferase n=1 Tax=Paenibacillus hamazuiensis TaxID=2936508 RepID=UPI00200CC4FD|nr:class I SAM-dependent methyltransferase [Paenibacillus hamazuiensis]
MLVTTSYDPTEEQLAQARDAAKKLGARLIRRGRLALERMKEQYGDPSVVLVTKERIEYHQEGYPLFYFHPSMAHVRIQRMLKGEQDTLMEAAGVRPGDRVLDCTAGLASDAIVFSHAVGESGSVVALESEKVVQYIVKDGLGRYESVVEPINRAMRRVELLHADHADYLRGAETDSVDIVYLDPMFRRPIHESSAISSIRGLANDMEIREETIREARRVARRCIVLKESKRSGEFERLGFTDIVAVSPKLAYGVIRL